MQLTKEKAEKMHTPLSYLSMSWMSGIHRPYQAYPSEYFAPEGLITHTTESQMTEHNRNYWTVHNRKLLQASSNVPSGGLIAWMSASCGVRWEHQLSSYVL